MNKLSNHERRGLQQTQTVGGLHPDADLLTAFSERTLSPRERQEVLGHLASCPTCREVVILSAPELVAPARVARTAKPWLWRWPVLRWGAVAASAVVIVAAVSIGYRESKQPVAERSEEQVAATMSRQVPAESGDGFIGKVISPGTSAGVKPPKFRYEKVEPAQPEKRALDERDRRAVGGIVQESPVVAGTAPQLTPPTPVQSEQTRADAANAPVLSRQDRIATLNAAEIKGAPMTSSPAAAPKSDALSAKNEAVPPPSRTEAVEVMAKSAPMAQQDTQLSDKLTKQKEQVLARKAAVAPRANAEIATFSADAKTASAGASHMLLWQVSPEGYVENSADRGRNWSQALPSSGFRVVAHIQNEVWAGGANGVLLHSVDSGISWNRVSPRQKDTPLRGDITGIKFTDTKNGSITTSAGETWITSDGGHSWLKQ